MEPLSEKLVCIKCGYDLRGTPGKICSECGTAFDREDRRHSFIPWERDVYGLWRFPMTIIATLFWKNRMRADCLCQHDYAKSRRFLVYMSLLCASPLLLVFFWVFYYYTLGKLSDNLLNESQDILRRFRPDSYLHYFDPEFLNHFTPGFQMLLHLLGMTLKGSWGFFWGILCIAIWNWDWIKTPGDVFKNLGWKTADMREIRAIGNYMAAPAGTALLLFWIFIIIQAYLSANHQLGVFTGYGDKTQQSLILNCVSAVFAGLCVGRLVFLIHRIVIYKKQLEPTLKTGLFSIVSRLILAIAWRGALWAIALPCFIGLTRLAIECVEWTR